MARESSHRIRTVRQVSRKETEEVVRGVAGVCSALIFYLRKDHTLKGGNLLYKLNGKDCVQTIKTGDILQFKGDIEHCPEPVTGFGCRDIIVVFIKRTKE